MSLMVAFIAGCSSGPLRTTTDACKIFQQKGSWYRAALRTEKKWQIRVPTLLAVIQQESNFKHNARPPRKRGLFGIPGRRASTAYGYAQAIDGAWVDYQKGSGNRRARRDHFADAVDFVGWYLNRAARQAGIARSSARNLYLSYHEGVRGYQFGRWRSSLGLIRTAQRVANQASRYESQLNSCRRGAARRYSRGR